MEFLTVGVLISGAGILLGMILLAVSTRFGGPSTVESRLEDFVVEYERTSRQNAPIGPGGVVLVEKFEGSLMRRTVLPALHRFALFLGKLSPARSNVVLEEKLSVAGNPAGLRALEFTGLRIFLVLIGIALGVLINLNITPVSPLRIAAGALIALLFFIAPLSWLDTRVRLARDEVAKSLPDALDMLSVCAYAGLGFDQSLQRVVEYWHTSLGIEFGRVVQEMELGVTRAQALRNMANRLQVPELSSFVAVIVQAETLGMQISDVLHGQAEQMRILRQFRAKEIANRLPAKMMIPLALLILPALLAVIFAPAVPRLIGLFANTR
jgi:tight adherence protein C